MIPCIHLITLGGNKGGPPGQNLSLREEMVDYYNACSSYQWDECLPCLSSIDALLRSASIDYLPARAGVMYYVLAFQVLLYRYEINARICNIRGKFVTSGKTLVSKTPHTPGNLRACWQGVTSLPRFLWFFLFHVTQQITDVGYGENGKNSSKDHTIGNLVSNGVRCKKHPQPLPSVRPNYV
eukprot:sb/3471568/